MISEVFLLPIVFLCAFFKDLYDSLIITPTKRLLINIAFSICISVVYGFLLGLYIAIVAAIFFKAVILNIWIMLLLSMIALEVIQFAIICVLHQDQVILPAVYLNVVLLGAHIHYEKYLKRFILKLIILATMLFILITTLIFSIISERVVVPIIIVTFSLAILIALMILNRVKYDTLKKAINQMILNLIVSICLILFTLIRLRYYNNLSTITNIMDIAVLISGAFYSCVTIQSLIVKVYEKFLDDFHNNLTYVWDELIKNYGFNTMRSKFNKEIHDFKWGLSHLKLLWEKGERKKVIKHFSITILFFLFTFGMLTLFMNYDDDILNVLKGRLQVIGNYWILLFNGNKAYASISLMLIIFASVLFYSLWKIIDNIRRKNKFHNIRIYIGRVFIACFFISAMISVFPIFNAEKCLYIAFVFLLFNLLSDFIFKKIYKDTDNC